MTVFGCRLLARGHRGFEMYLYIVKGRSACSRFQDECSSSILLEPLFRCRSYFVALFRVFLSEIHASLGDGGDARGTKTYLDKKYTVCTRGLISAL